MRERIKKNPVLACVVIFLILIAVHGFEAIVIRTDRTILGENCINKLFGIAVTAAVLGILGNKPVAEHLPDLAEGTLPVETD